MREKRRDGKRMREKRRDGKGMREEEGWKEDERRGGMERG